MTPKVVQIDIPVTDLDIGKAFYQEVFSLKASPAELYSRIILEVPRDTQVGLSLVLIEEGNQFEETTQKHRSIAIYLEVKNLDEVLAKCQALKIVCSMKQKNPPYGWLATVEDPFKNIIHICQPF